MKLRIRENSVAQKSVKVSIEENVWQNIKRNTIKKSLTLQDHKAISMTGNKNSGRNNNPYSRTLNLDAELGKAFNQIQDEDPFTKVLGTATYQVYDHMKTHEKRFREILGDERFEFYLKKWSIPQEEQKEARKEKTIKQYMGFGFPREKAEEYYEIYGEDTKPIDVVKQINATQNSDTFKLQTEIAAKKNEEPSEEEVKKQVRIAELQGKLDYEKQVNKTSMLHDVWVNELAKLKGEQQLKIE